MKAVLALEGTVSDDPEHADGALGMSPRRSDKDGKSADDGKSAQDGNGKPELGPLDFARAAADAMPAMAYFHYQFADRALAVEDASGARSAFETVLRRYPWHPESHTGLARALEIERSVAEEAAAGGRGGGGGGGGSGGAKSQGGAGGGASSNGRSGAENTMRAALLAARLLHHRAAAVAVRPNDPLALIELAKELYGAAAVYGNTPVINTLDAVRRGDAAGTASTTAAKGTAAARAAAVGNGAMAASVVLFEEAKILLAQRARDPTHVRAQGTADPAQEIESFLAAIYHRLGKAAIAAEHVEHIEELEEESEDNIAELASRLKN
jgi:hypothetical protein